VILIGCVDVVVGVVVGVVVDLDGAVDVSATVVEAG
jgi:hypothetical protein